MFTQAGTDWELAEHTVHILQAFYDATLELRSYDACLSLVVPLTAMLLGKLQ